ncbi:ABC transporter permease, partial [Aliarcobacter butzleri]
IRSESFAITTKPYIKILHISNISNFKIVFIYFAPLLAPIFLISFTFVVGGAILAESGLSIFGLGINPPNMSWGSLLS